MFPVIKQSAEVQASDALRDQIILGKIPLGTRIKEASLAEQLHLSRATVRTALHQLVNEGLVVQIPYVGWEVPMLSAQDAWELYTLRSGLEALAAHLVAQKRSPQVNRQLTQVFDALVAACRNGTAETIAIADFAFHSTLIELTEHRRLQTHYRLIEQQIRLFIVSSNALTLDPQRIIDLHASLLAALQTGEVEAAERRARDHILNAGIVFVEHLRGNEASSLS